MGHRVIHFEIPTSEPEKAIRFYGDIFDWEFTKWEGSHPYWLIQTGQGQGIDGGLMMKRAPGHPLTNTIQVEDVDDYAKRIEAAGGQIVVPKMAIPGVGYAIYFKDLDNIMGIFHSDQNAV